MYCAKKSFHLKTIYASFSRCLSQVQPVKPEQKSIDYLEHERDEEKGLDGRKSTEVETVAERGLVTREEFMTGLGRVLRMFVSKERYDNFYEQALMSEFTMKRKFNAVDDITLLKHGPEWALGQIILNLGGALKLRFDDRWIEDTRSIRTPKKNDFRLEGIDLRNSAITHLGLKYTEGAQFVRYLNVGDCKFFDDHAMSFLHPLSDSLEFLDISGTSVTERGLGYLRLFTKLKYLNLSRLEKAKNMAPLLPYLEEILPNCCIILDDVTAAESYGYPIPFRHPTNLKKDLQIENNTIGDLTLYESDRATSVVPYNPETIHALWQTPVIGRERRGRFHIQRKVDRNFLFTLVKYIVKAEKYKPLL